MTMIIGCKRLLEEYLADPLAAKRCRQYALPGDADDGVDGGCPAPAWSSQEAGFAAGLAAAVDALEKRGHSIDELGSEPADKRLRLHAGTASAGSSSIAAEASATDGGSDSVGVDPAAVRTWAEVVVRALHGSPSIEDATQRCARVLAEYGEEVRQTALREVEPVHERRPCEDEHKQDGTQGLQHTNRVLMRAVHHLAERCRRLEAAPQEAAALQQALEQSQEAQRRLAHSNEVLQGHLKVQLDKCHCNHSAWVR
mmetsp:Transcript_36415/g.79653  ORF Transcript_36415/g.79653 Transcript_36415/m.79653 type:complete len:255 (+) Transcript_36415:97-861(+)|eukprot:CAMPEP_0170612708 /NCGR_PEP_ID=MMETSP0224-20130122/23870_1 /TAXON_ID=285029 /ORGANISM="Togula jolla, Strain CCCM 725" /LENGTH=254 /DNA_ID=CAMNT_0010938235 /DNA_START=97 /DNA_END=861 /DNA_ORIENTATION=+